jgi:Helix-turn-helix domain
VAKALAKGSRITGAPRATLASQLAKRYGAGESIRKISEDTGRSFGFIHGVLKESGVALRGRGGATRGVKKAAPPAGTGKKAATARSIAKRTTGTKASTAQGAAKKVATAKAAAKKTPAPKANQSGSKTAPTKAASKRAAAKKR